MKRQRCNPYDYSTAGQRTGRAPTRNKGVLLVGQPDANEYMETVELK